MGESPAGFVDAIFGGLAQEMHHPPLAARDAAP
jgi:hypothetical protein